MLEQPLKYTKSPISTPKKYDDHPYHLSIWSTPNWEPTADIFKDVIMLRSKVREVQVLTTWFPNDAAENNETRRILEVLWNETKRKDQQRVVDVEVGSFTPHVFGTSGGMGSECHITLRQLIEKLEK